MKKAATTIFMLSIIAYIASHILGAILLFNSVKLLVFLVVLLVPFLGDGIALYSLIKLQLWWPIILYAVSAIGYVVANIMLQKTEYKQPQNNSFKLKPGTGAQKSAHRLLEDEYKNEYPWFVEQLTEIAFAHTQVGFSDEEYQTMFYTLRMWYLEKVRDNLIDAIEKIGSDYIARYKLALESPYICGLPDCDEVIPGALYYMVYYALTEEQGLPEDAVSQNHIFASYIDSALSDVDAKLKECSLD